ncbi:MAG: extracellular solute-binding protein [Aeromicrobium sp.]|uniref:extracellular solute-binding protein n=1 Tax=Aeromicrobium sp. TaxID=1871063 RepID=UPI0039E4557F
MTSRGRTARAAAVAGSLLLSASALSACAGAGDERGVVRWYLADASTYAPLARSCTDDAGGSYRIELVEAPADPAERRADLVQRLRTGEQLDITGVDTAEIAELAGSGLLADLPGDAAADLVEGRNEAAVDAVTVGSKVVAAPWWYEPQVLLYRGSVAERAGLDMTRAITWNELTAGAARIGGTVQIAGTMTQWVGALAAGEDGKGFSDSRDLAAVLSGPGGADAAAVVRTYAGSDVGPGPSAQAADAFAAPGGTFLVGPVSLLSSSVLGAVRNEVHVAPYPLVSAAAETPVSPMAGMALAVTENASDTRHALDAVACLTGEESQRWLVANTGHLPTLESVLTAEETTADLGGGDLVTTSLAGGVPEPKSPDAALLARAVETTWWPLASVGEATPGTTAAELRRLQSGGLA